jgi:hypothetical protein
MRERHFNRLEIYYTYNKYQIENNRISKDREKTAKLTILQARFDMATNTTLIIDQSAVLS